MIPLSPGSDLSGAIACVRQMLIDAPVSLQTARGAGLDGLLDALAVLRRDIDSGAADGESLDAWEAVGSLWFQLRLVASEDTQALRLLGRMEDEISNAGADIYDWWLGGRGW